MAVYHVTATPYATQEGTIEIPDGIEESEVRDYIDNHWDDIDFSEPELDYAGTDLEIYKEEE